MIEFNGIADQRMTAVEGVLGQCKALLANLAAAEVATMRDGLPMAPPSRAPAPASLPVLAWLADLPALATPATLPLVTALITAAPDLAWGQTYATDEVPAGFLKGYGWSELVGARGPYASPDLALGFLLLGPDTIYPLHRHAAEEVYVVLAGTAEWRRGRAPFQPRPPGTVIHHPPWLPHAMRTAREPLLALYLWRGGDLTEKSRFSDADET